MRSVLLAASLILTATAGAQVIPRPTKPPVPVPQRNPSDTTRKADSTQTDSAKARVLIEWEEPDSMTNELLSRKGYEVTRYQGMKVVFNAKTRTLYLEGVPAGVGRNGTLLVGDTITYNDSTKVVLALGDTLILRDPSRGSADVIALHQMRYNVASQRGSVMDISTALESGETWYVRGSRAGFVRDPTGGPATRFYARNASITSCDDSVPDYHFQAKEVKLIGKNLMVARPAVLYIGDVPVFWLPFIFQDMRTGRRSGLLTPRFGVNEIFRNSPSYRRHVDNFGYYFALSDYTDAQVSLDWRSGAGASEGDPGWLRLNGEWRYRWMDRFLTGRFGVSQMWQRDGSRNTALSWAHQQDFSQDTHLTTDLNYVTSTALQRQNSFDPRQVLATIRSNASFQRKFGPFSMSVGGSRLQYPGRSEITQDFPNFTISSPTLSLGERFDWTPALTISNHEQRKVDRNGEFAFRYTNVGGVLDSARLKSDSRASSLNLSTPFKIFGFAIPLSLRVSDQENNNPVRIKVVDQDDPTQRIDRIFARTYSTEVDWSTGFSLPQFFPTTLKLSPSVGISNVDGHAYWVRTEQTGGRYVHQSKRLNYGAGMSPTIFGLFPGIGPVSRFRHTISTNVSYSYAPASTVNREFLSALNIDPTSYIGNIAQNSVTLQVQQVLEAKLKSRDTTGTAEPKKIKLLGLNLSPLSYDFERKRKTGQGFRTENITMDFNSDLLPGFAASVQYSLFQGAISSDTSKFKPFRTNISASWSINGNSGIFGALTRMLGRAVPTTNAQVERLQPGSTDALEQRVASTPVAGVSPRNQLYNVPSFQAWQASFTFSSNRQRPPVGNAVVVVVDPRDRCSPLANGNPLIYDQCILTQSTTPTGAEPIGSLTSGGPFIRIPPSETLTSNMGFHITPKWTSTWSTTYNFQERQFASHQVSLQRELHDWRAIFAFTKSQNGNFAFNFHIALNAQPDLKFDYDKQTYRQSR